MLVLVVLLPAHTRAAGGAGDDGGGDLEMVAEVTEFGVDGGREGFPGLLGGGRQLLELLWYWYMQARHLIFCGKTEIRIIGICG